MIKNRMVWGVVTLLVATLFYSHSLLAKASAESAPTVESVYPGLSTGILRSAALVKMDKDTLLQGDGIEVKASFAEKTFSQVPPAFRKEVEKTLFFLLEQEATRELIKLMPRPWAFQWTSLKNRWGRRTSRA